MSEGTLEVYRSESGELRIRTDQPGERAVSAAIADPAALIEAIAFEAGLLVDITEPLVGGSGSGGSS